MAVFVDRLDEMIATEDWVYPVVGLNHNGNLLVLFVREGRGTVLQDSEGNYEVGHVEDRWDMDTFSIYYGKVTLQND